MSKHFEELEIWLMAKDLSIKVYSRFRDCKDYRFRDQIQAAAVSVMNNIAEGFERKKASKEMERFLYISKGSAGEVRSMLYLALEFKYIAKADYEAMKGECLQLSRAIYAFIAAL